MPRGHKAAVFSLQTEIMLAVQRNKRVRCLGSHKLVCINKYQKGPSVGPFSNDGDESRHIKKEEEEEKMFHLN